MRRFAVHDTYARLKILPINPSFEGWRVSTLPDNWDLLTNGTVTIARSTTLFSAGASSLAATLLTGTYGGVSQNIPDNDPARPLTWWIGKSVVFRVKLRATLATASAYVQISDGTTFLYQNVNPSAGMFNMVESPPLTINPGASVVQVQLYTAAIGVTVYFDEAEVLVTEPELFRGGLFEPPSIDESLSDTYYGTREVSQVQLKIARGQGEEIPELYAKTTKGVGMRAYAYDPDGSKALLWDGVVNAVGLDDTSLQLEGTPNPINILEIEVPVDEVDETWPAGHGIGTGIALEDKGLSIPDVIGYVPRVRCVYVSEKLITNEYHYVCCRGTRAIPAMYRGVTTSSDKVQASLINPVEYTISYTAYPGYTAAIFPVRQIDFGGGASTIYADVATMVGSENERNPGRVIRNYLIERGQTVETASFDRAETEYARLGYVVDFALLEPVQLQDLFRSLLQMLDGVLTKTSAGWMLDIDIRPTTVDYVFQEGPQADVPTIIEISPRKTLPLLDETSRVVVKYLPDTLEPDVWLGKAVRRLSTSPHAVPLKIELPQVRDWNTADRLADYRAKQILTRSETLTITGPQIVAGRRRTLVNVTSPKRNLTNATYMIAKANRAIGGQPELELTPWSPDPYVYEPGAVPVDAIRGTFLDFSRIPPPIITDVTFPTGADFRGTETGPAGSIKAFVTVRFVTPTTGNYAYAVVRYRPALSVIWVVAGGPIAQSGTVDVKIRGLEPQVSYEYSVQSFNQWGLTAGGE